jgi:hypothetical protein
VYGFSAGTTENSLVEEMIASLALPEAVSSRVRCLSDTDPFSCEDCTTHAVENENKLPEKSRQTIAPILFTSRVMKPHLSEVTVQTEFGFC